MNSKNEYNHCKVPKITVDTENEIFKMQKKKKKKESSKEQYKSDEKKENTSQTKN